MGMSIPPLPEEQYGSTIGARHLWIILATHKQYPKEEIANKFMSLFNREPDRVYSPEESKTTFWWLGWVTREESAMWVEQNRLV